MLKINSYTHTVVATDVKRPKRKKKRSWRDGTCQDACVILGVRIFIYTCTNICSRVGENLIKSVYSTTLTCCFYTFICAFLTHAMEESRLKVLENMAQMKVLSVRMK
jgi:hypothetical protein